MQKSRQFVLWFNELGIGDVALVGGKNASLGEMYQKLIKKGVNLPNGFAVTSYAYQFLIKKAGVERHIRAILKGLDTHDMKDLAKRGAQIRAIIRNCEFPPELVKAISDAYKKLCRQYGKDADVAVRSSATAEDLPTASFAGQQETYLNIRGEKALINACRNCFASLFTNRAISYREDKGFSHFKVYLSIGVQKMIRSDLACSGVMFSIDTETGFPNVVFINGAYGLGENIVQGAVNPDEFYIFKPTMKTHNSILAKHIGDKRIKMVYSSGKGRTTKNVPVSEKDRHKFVLTDKEVLLLAKWACIIEDHYKKPMDMEWAKDGRTKQLYILQARPETVQSQRNIHVLEDYVLKQQGKVLAEGKSVGAKIAHGKAHIIKDVVGIANFKKDEVLVTDMTDPDWEPIMKIASAIVTNKGGRTCFSGDTRILTNKGFTTFEKIYALNNFDGIMVPSLNKNTLKMEWKPIIAVMKKKSNMLKIGISQTGRARRNTLKITPDHKMINIREGKIADTEIQDLLRHDECITTAQFIPPITKSTEKDKRLAYLLGAICTDGHVYTGRTHGEVQFIQKATPEKEAFISAVTGYFKGIYNKEAKVCPKPLSSGQIRGCDVSGSATAYRIYSKEIAYELKQEQRFLVQTILDADKEIIYNFLAGVIDGDGSFSPKSGRINIFISKEYLAQAVIIGCLKLGIFPQVTNNRNIHNIQIVEQIDEIIKYTQRIKGTSNRKRMATRFFNTKQIFDQKNYGSNINIRRKKNLFISEIDLLKEQKRFRNELKQKIDKLISSDIRQLRAVKQDECGISDVYNITVADNHNYAVFTTQYTPVLVNNCHAAIISRELGIPCIVGTNNATENVKNKQKITVSCAGEETGRIYDGFMKFVINKINLKHIPKTKTQIMVNLGNPEQAFELSFLPVAGVGLAREEFIINDHIKIHPRALIEFDKVKDPKERKKISHLTRAYKDKKEFFVEKLKAGVGMIAAAFYPRPVIVRMSDFKSNEYANLIGGKGFEPKEANPMIGWRGASRYYSKTYSKAFALECKALRKVRDELGLTNLKIMIPMCRTVEEAKKIIKELAKNGLKRGKKGLQIYCMCEVPSNVILLEEFAKLFDGFSIGSNDLTQTILAIDRDSSLVAHIFDERNEAVKRMVALAIQKAKKARRKIGICGDAPSTYEDFARFLVDCGIDSISLSPDAVMRTLLVIARHEKKR